MHAPHRRACCTAASAFRRKWLRPWSASAGTKPATGCGGKRPSTSLRRGSEPPRRSTAGQGGGERSLRVPSRTSRHRTVRGVRPGVSRDPTRSPPVFNPNPPRGYTPAVRAGAPTTASPREARARPSKRRTVGRCSDTSRASGPEAGSPEPARGPSAVRSASRGRIPFPASQEAATPTLPTGGGREPEERTPCR